MAVTKKKVAKKATCKGEKRQNDADNAIVALEARISVLEYHNTKLLKSLKRGANEVRPYFGLSGIATVFDNIADRLTP